MSRGSTGLITGNSKKRSTEPSRSEERSGDTRAEDSARKTVAHAGAAVPESASADSIHASRAAHWLTSWWHSPAGIRLLAEQAPNIATEVRRFHGDHLLWLGCHNPSTEFVRRCMIRYRFYAAIPGTCPSSDIASFSCDPQALPVSKGTVSAVTLHHVLDCVPDPRQLIREVARITEPGGRLLICGFNPWGRWGAAALVDRARQLTGTAATGLRPIGTSRLLDWLALLGYEVTEEVRFLGHPLPASVSAQRGYRWLRSERRALGASSYMISATKRCGAAQQPPQHRGLAHARPLTSAGFARTGESS